jgi:hypothetical protein
MQWLLTEYRGAFNPDRFARLSLHSTKHGSPFRPAERSLRRMLRLKSRGRSSQNILLRPLSKASVTNGGYATALYWPWLNQIYDAEACRVRCG